jgi:hypothetical protein
MNKNSSLLFTAFLCVAAIHSANAASTPAPSHIVYSASSSLCLDVATDKTVGALAQLSTCSNTSKTQNWKFVVEGKGYFIQNVGTSLCLVPTGGSTSAGQLLIQSGCGNGGSTEMIWMLSAIGSSSSSYNVINERDQFCMDLPGGKASVGAHLQQVTCKAGSASSLWSLSSSPTGTSPSPSPTVKPSPTPSPTVTTKPSPTPTPTPTPSATATAGSGTTWYIRQDGGTNTQCTGKTNAAYSGSGTNQACAFNHPFQMLNYSGAWASMKGGDTIQFADPKNVAHTYFMGEENNGVGTDWHAQIGGICPTPNGDWSGGSSCILPILPSGTKGHPTQVIGQNAGSCHTADHTGLVNPTIFSGLNGAFALLDVQGTNYVSISCIETTQPDNCSGGHAGGYTGSCTNSSNFVSYAGLMLGYLGNQGPSNFTLQDFSAVGIATNGILGSHINTASTDVFNASDIYLIGNGAAGWNGDGGGCTTNCETVGTMNLSYVDIEWSGCVAVKPYITTIGGNGFNYCYGQNDGGYGDGFVQVAAGNMTLNVSHSTFKYNVQDGFDSLHLSDDVSTKPVINLTDSWSEGNGGQTFKMGAGSAATAINNVSISNCHILSDTTAFAKYNNPKGWIALDNGDTCRASGDEWAFQMDNGTSITLENNTSIGYGTTMYDVGCAYLAPNCMTNDAHFIFRNNISVGLPDPQNDGRLASGFYFGTSDVFANAGSAIDHNIWYNMDSGCPDNQVPEEKSSICVDPKLANETSVDAIIPTLSSGSPAVGVGVSLSNVTTDFNGTARPNPPAVGAYQ